MIQLNTEHLFRILKDFHTLTNLRIVLFDSDFQEILAYPPHWEGFCARLRQDPTEDAKCRSSDRESCKACAASKELILYRCHAGLTEAVVPIQDKSGVIAYIMFGQVLPADHSDEARRNLKRRYPLLLKEINNIAVKPENELNAAGTVLQALTAYVMNNGWVIPGKSEFIRQLDRYIDENMQIAITVNDLCLALHLTRSKMYDLSLAYLGCGLAEHVRRRRILRAQQLLIQTELSVSEVACAVGLPDYNHFSRVFKRICGVSARNYRNQNQMK